MLCTNSFGVIEKIKPLSLLGSGIAAGYDFYEQYQLIVRLKLDMTFRGKGATNGSIAYDIYGEQGISNY